MKMKRFLCGISFLLFAFSCSEDGGSKKTETQYSISGTLQLSSDITEDPELSSGEVIDEATVFLKGLPDKTATTDVSGSFTLNINEDELATIVASGDGSGAGLSAKENQNLSIVLWKETSAGTLYGSQVDNLSFQNSNEISVGAVELTYTSGIRLILSQEDDSGEKATIEGFVENCSAVFLGYEGKIDLAKDENRFSSSYMPAANYTIRISCPNFAVQDYSFDFPTTTPTSSGQWEVIDVVMEIE